MQPRPPRDPRPLDLDHRVYRATSLDLPALLHLRRDQEGVITRRQLLEQGCTASDVRRLQRNRELEALHPGVYLWPPERPTWGQRAWAAVLALAPAVLSHRSALVIEGIVQESDGPIHAAVAHRRRPTAPEGVVVHRLSLSDRQVHGRGRPPRQRLEHAVVAECGRATDTVAALALLADVCRERRTTPDRLRAALTEHTRLRHRAVLLDALADLEDGAESVLELAYLRRVERAHGLPTGRRQVGAAGRAGRLRRDVEYAVGVVVELDGKQGHHRSRDRWDDMDRDLDAAASGLLTLRIGWRQVHHDACRTAATVATVLQQRGWRGRPRPCGARCPVAPPDKGKVLAT